MTHSVFADPRTPRELGDLFTNIWQVAYITKDLDQGMEVLRERFGVGNITEVPTEGATFLKGDEPAEWDVRVAMGARGGVIVELIEAVGGEVDFYRRALPENGTAIGVPPPRDLHPGGRRGLELPDRAARPKRPGRGLHRADP